MCSPQMGDASLIKCQCGGFRYDCPLCDGGGWADESHAVVAALVVAAGMGLPADIQELLLHGEPARGIRPGILLAMLKSWDD